MKSQATRLIALAVGLPLLIGSIYLLKAENAPEGAIRTVLYVCIAIGCALSGSGLSGWLGNRIVRSNPAVQKQLDIEKQDERNQMIANRAKAKAFDLYVCVFSVLLWALALMGTELPALLLLLAAHFFVLGVGLYYRFKYDREL